jgi:hypothetical protein
VSFARTPLQFKLRQNSMTVLKPRRRLVMFRLNEEEYESLKAACLVREARSVSDFARAAVLRLADDAAGGGVEALTRRLADLEKGVRRILERLEATNKGAV